MRTTADYVHVFCNRASWCVLPFGHSGDCDVKAAESTITVTGSESGGRGWVADEHGLRPMTDEEQDASDELDHAEAKPSRFDRNTLERRFVQFLTLAIFCCVAWLLIAGIYNLRLDCR